MASSQTTITPHNQQPLVTRTFPSEPELDGVIRRAAVAHQLWARVPLKGRLAIGAKFVDEFQKLSDEIPLELTLQMGRYAFPVFSVRNSLTGVNNIAQCRRTQGK